MGTEHHVYSVIMFLKTKTKQKPYYFPKYLLHHSLKESTIISESVKEDAKNSFVAGAAMLL
jgi:hypothetical protein